MPPPVSHVDSYAYPTPDQFKAAIPHAFKIVTGASDLDLNSQVKCAHTVASYALGVAMPHQHEAMAAPKGLKSSLEDKLAQLDLHKEDGYRAVDWGWWLELADQVLDFIRSLIPRTA